MATWTLELTTQVKYVSPPGAKFMTAHLQGQTKSALLEGFPWPALLRRLCLATPGQSSIVLHMQLPVCSRAA